ncbi:hypothetical protein BH11PSE8_BH11PSE8_21490 [soil metagenome]
MRELFIYYRVRSEQAVAALATVRAAQTRLSVAFPELRMRLLQRPETVDGCQTWMETYATDPMNAPQGITPALEAAIDSLAQAALAPYIAGPRHTEAFIACAS